MKDGKIRPVENGYYYHYKHRPERGFADYAYRVIGSARHSETRESLVLYRPLYSNDYFRWDFSARPLSMFKETVTVGKARRRRFRRITDPSLVRRLAAIDRRLYPRRQLGS